MESTNEQFEKKHLYWVFKRKHLDNRTDDALRLLSEAQNQTKATPDSLVIESDWPLFNQAWEDLKNWHQGKQLKVDQLLDELRELKEAEDNISVIFGSICKRISLDLKAISTTGNLSALSVAQAIQNHLEGLFTTAKSCISEHEVSREEELSMKWGMGEISDQEKNELISITLGKSMLLDDIAIKLKYPEQWDTKKYPTLMHAVNNMAKHINLDTQQSH